MGILSGYQRRIEKALASGNATEHTYRPALKELIESLAEGLTATNEPKRIECGAPDYIVTRGETPLGYIEAKDVGESLDRVERSEQLQRYLESLGNLILTDYLEFRWYVRSDHRLTARLGRVGAKSKLQVEKRGEKEVVELLNAFLNAQVPTIGSSKELAVRMAALARLIRDTICRAFEDEDEGESLHQQMEGFRKVLLHDLTKEQFADMYAQTICYGLFAARCNVKGGEQFSRQHAAYDLPKTNPFLRRMFGYIAGPELDDRIVWVVDDLAELLRRADMDAILKDFGRRTHQEDPVVHFYETFLAAYDPKMREVRGVYYTPEPVVSYIVRSVDYILKADFGLSAGLADASTIKMKSPDGKGKINTHKVLILDPATGTGTFLHSVIDLIYESFKGNKGMWSGYVSQHLLPRLFGFELLMAPYAVAHMKLGLQLAETGYDFKADERLRVYLTNTLEEAHEMSGLPLFTQWLAEEANAASLIKRALPIMVILGNPPYSGISVNSGEWIESLMEDYKVTVRAEERQIQRLSNDYVKFVRFAQWRLEKSGGGILGFITDSGYLDGILFRDMRHSLLETFSHILILNLHGTAVRGPSRSSDNDKNVFDITQGVAIGIFVKKMGKKGPAKVRYTDLRGARERKYQLLLEWDVSNTPWSEIEPHPPHWYLVPTVSDEVYESWRSFTAITGTGNSKDDRDKRYGTGIKTRHDEFVIGWSVEDAVARVRRIANRSETDEELIEELKLCTTTHFDIKCARERAKAADLANYVRPIAYRPFDRRYLVYLREFICEPKTETMKHLLHEDNIALAVLRRDRKALGTGYFVVRGLTAKDLVSNVDDALIWPLYLYPSSTTEPQEVLMKEQRRQPNLVSGFTRNIASQLGFTFIPDGLGDLISTFGPEDVLHYIYAVLYSPTYRSRYIEALKRDFPRLPLTSNPDVFRALCNIGEALVELHLMERHASTTTRYPIVGDNMVEAVRYTEPSQGANEGRVWINKTQYFEGVSPEVWAFHVGGYQVCQKWLKDRKGRRLTYDDLSHYQRIVTALADTIRLMREIDETINEHGGWPLA